MSFVIGLTTAFGVYKAGAEAYDMFFGGGDQGTPGRTGAQYLTAPQYSFTEPRLQLTSDYITQNLQRLQEGKYPVYYEQAKPQLREAMSRELQETYYGVPGERTGIAGRAREAGAALGLGAAPTFRQEEKVYREYARKENEIDEYLTQIGVQLMGQAEQTALDASIRLPKGPDAQAFSYSIPAQEGGSKAKALGNLLSSLSGLVPKKTTDDVDETGSVEVPRQFTPAEIAASPYQPPTQETAVYGSGINQSYIDYRQSGIGQDLAPTIYDQPGIPADYMSNPAYRVQNQYHGDTQWPGLQSTYSDWGLLGQNVMPGLNIYPQYWPQSNTPSAPLPPYFPTP